MRPRTTILYSALVIALSVNGRAQALDFQTSVHVFPQFVDGTLSENRSYFSTLHISAIDFSSQTRCSLGLLSVPPITLTDARGARETNTIFNFILAPSGWQMLQSQGTQTLRSGSAILQCDRAVTAHMIYTLNTGGVISSEATVSAAPAGRMVQLLADQRRDSRLGVAIMNPFSTSSSYRISVIDIDGRLVSTTIVQIPPLQSFTRFLDEFAPVPRNYRGPIVIETMSGTDVYAAGLRFTAESFTAVPATVRIR